MQNFYSESELSGDSAVEAPNGKGQQASTNKGTYRGESIKKIAHSSRHAGWRGRNSTIGLRIAHSYFTQVDGSCVLKDNISATPISGEGEDSFMGAPRCCGQLRPST